ARSEGFAVPLYAATGFSAQRISKPFIREFSGSYAHIIWPAWVINMVSFPEIALEIVLKNVVPAILSSSIGAYIGWRLSQKQKKDELRDKIATTVPDGVLTECMRVTDFILEEMLRYHYYLFDKDDIGRAQISLNTIAANFVYLINMAKEFDDPVLVSDLTAL